MDEYVDLGMKSPCGDWNNYQSRIEAQPEMMREPLHISVQEFCDHYLDANSEARDAEKMILDQHIDVFTLKGKTRTLLESAKAFAADLKAKQSVARQISD